MSISEPTSDSGALSAVPAAEGWVRRPPSGETIHALVVRVRAEYNEMPGMRLTVCQAARLFDIPADAAQAVLEGLCRASVLTRSERDTYSLIR
jgi:hypothetical protein